MPCPLIRIDDYPTGVRPRGNMYHINRFLLEIDDLGVEYVLGIVPTLLYSGDIEFLRSLKNCKPALHGFDHCYFEKSRICRENSDFKNKYSVSGDFTEFGGRLYEECFYKLSSGKFILESIFGQKIEYYIPPCNNITRETDLALEALGIRKILSENTPEFPTNNTYIKSDFYGKLQNFQPNNQKVVTLHATWEADDIEDGMFEFMKDKLKCLI